MYALLHQYLITHKELDLPGIGLLQVIEIPARYTMADKTLHAPYPAIRCKPERMQVDPTLYHWLSVQLTSSIVDAKKRFNTFVGAILEQLTMSNQAHWEGLGSFKKDDANIIKFTWEHSIQNSIPRITIEKGITHDSIQADHSSYHNNRSRTFFRSPWWIWSFLGAVLLNIGICTYLIINENIPIGGIIRFIQSTLYTFI